MRRQLSHAALGPFSLFRRRMGVHPDEYMPVGISLDIAAYQASKPEV
jgi:hypothetical protein